MIDIRRSLGEQAVQDLNSEFGRKRAVFFHCDVTNNSEFDGKYMYTYAFENVKHSFH